MYCKANVYNRSLREKEFNEVLRRMLKQVRIDHGYGGADVKFQYFYDLLLQNDDERQPYFRIFRGFTPESQTSAFDQARVFSIRTEDDLPKLSNRIQFGLQNREFAAPNFEDSSWKVHSCVNVIVTAVCLLPS